MISLHLTISALENLSGLIVALSFRRHKSNRYLDVRPLFETLGNSGYQSSDFNKNKLDNRLRHRYN